MLFSKMVDTNFRRSDDCFKSINIDEDIDMEVKSDFSPRYVPLSRNRMYETLQDQHNIEVELKISGFAVRKKINFVMSSISTL